MAKPFLSVSGRGFGTTAALEKKGTELLGCKDSMEREGVDDKKKAGRNPTHSKTARKAARWFVINAHAHHSHVI